MPTDHTYFFFRAKTRNTYVYHICIYVLVYVTHQVIHIHVQAVLFSNLSLDFSSQSFKFWSKFTTACLFRVNIGFITFCKSSFLFQG